MKTFFLVTILVFSFQLSAQDSMTIRGSWNHSEIGQSSANLNYNEIWGIVNGEREYAVIGSFKGTHFIDITDPENPLEVAFIEGGFSSTSVIHRDFHDYKGYLYAVCDEGSSSSLQIIDFSYLPDSVHLVYDDSNLITKSHNVFVDSTNKKLYSLGTFGPATGAVPMAIFDIEDPTNPVLMNIYQSIDNVILGYVHDAYVKNDTAFLNCGSTGLVIADFSNVDSAFVISALTTTEYPHSGYNHSGWVTEDNKTYVMADETTYRDLKVFDIENLPEIELRTTINPGDSVSHIPHNPIIKGDYLYSSYYLHGLQVWNISNPNEPIKTHFFIPPVPEHRAPRGIWGIYPFLPSGNLIVSDMVNGLYVLAAIDKDITQTETVVEEQTKQLTLYPSPTTDYIIIERDFIQSTDELFIYNINGQLLDTKLMTKGTKSYYYSINKDWQKGIYFVKLLSNDNNYIGKFILE